jgi:hypothetical protein
VTADAEAAARLVTLGLRPKQLPARDAVYAELVRRYGADDDFKGMVNAVAAGMGLLVLAVTMRTGAVLAATEESVFEIKMDEYSRRAALRERRDVDKVLHGLIHLAVAALAFPRPDDLANDTYVGRISVEQVDGVVREASRMLDERARDAEQNQDPLEDAPELERAWRAYARRSAVAVTKDNRLAPDSTRGMVTKAMRFLTDQGLLQTAGDEQGGTYRTTARYQVQVRELAAERAFDELLDLGVVSVKDGSGSLHTLSDQMV